MGHKRRMQGQQLARKLILPLAAALVVLATSGGAPAQERPFSPNAPGATGAQAQQAGASDKGTPSADIGLSDWMTLAPSSDPAYWSSFPSGSGGNVRAGNAFDRNDASASSGATPPGDQLKVGSSYLGIQIDKNVQILESLRRNNCGDDDECSEYTGLPKTERPKASVKNFKRPFIGLSITRPIE